MESIRLALRRKLVVGVTLLLAGLAVTAAGLWRQGQAAAGVYGPSDPHLLRMHVLAHSDAPAEQALKRQVRDALLPLVQALTREASSPEQLAVWLQREVPQIRAAAELALRAAGSDHPVRVELGEYDYDARQYADLYLPAGRYRALRVVIGDGGGHNWWCVLFPNLCFNEWISQVEPSGLTEEEQATLAAARQAMLLDERETAELPVQADSAVLRWLRGIGLIP